MKIFILYPSLALLLFLLTNWLGKYSENLGYNQIDFIVDKEGSIAFNFSLKILTSVVFIIVISSFFYFLGFDDYVKNIYLIVWYSVCIRLIFNIFMDRYHIINKPIYFFNAFCICLFSYITYIYIIEPKKPIIPDFNTLSNELWIIILIFIYNTINKIEISESAKEKRLKNYILVKYKNINKKYQNIINDNLNQFILREDYQHFVDTINLDNKEIFIEKNKKFLEFLTYSVIIFENFNRPFLFRKVENLFAKYTQYGQTLGIMQVSTNEILSDLDSINVGMQKIFDKYYQELTSNGQRPYQILDNIIFDYNQNDIYQYSILNIMRILSKKIYGSDIYEEWYQQIYILNNGTDGE